MRRRAVPFVLVPVLAAGCAAHRETPTSGTLAELRKVHPDVKEATVDSGLEQAMQGYRRFLDETPETSIRPEAMRRLAALKLEKQFGIRTGDGEPRAMAAPAGPAAAGSPARAAAESLKRGGTSRE